MIIIPPLHYPTGEALHTFFFTSWLLHFICFVNFFIENDTKDLEGKKLSYLITRTLNVVIKEFTFLFCKLGPIIILPCKFHYILRRLSPKTFNYWISFPFNLQLLLLWFTITIVTFRFTQWWTSVDWRTCLSWLWNKILRNNTETSLVRHVYCM